MPFRIELCTFAIIIELSGENGLDIFLIGSQDQSHSYSPYLTSKWMDCRAVCKSRVPSCEQIIIALIAQCSCDEAEAKWHPCIDCFRMSSQRSNFTLLLYSCKQVSAEYEKYNAAQANQDRAVVR
jgi:hypothetical protein